MALLCSYTRDLYCVVCYHSVCATQKGCGEDSIEQGYVGNGHQHVRSCNSGNDYYWITINCLSLLNVSSHQHVGMDFNRIIRAFIVYRNEPGGPAAYFTNNLSSFENVFGSTTYISQTILGDAFVVSCVVCSISGMHHV